MSLKLLEPAHTSVISLDEVKIYLRIDHPLEDSLLLHLIQLATQWIEEATGKSLLTKKWSYTHQNNSLILPNPPISDILEVRTKRKILSPKDFEIQDRRGTTKIVIPFAWERRTFTVTYKAGFGDCPEDVPLALRHAVLTATAHLYENRLSSTCEQRALLFQQVEPWIQYYRRFELV